MIEKNKVLKIVVPILIVCVIGGIWLVKSNERMKNSEPAVSIEPIDFSKTTETETSAQEKSDMLKVTSLDLDALKSEGLPILIDFGAETCIPCMEMAPILEELNETYRGKVIVKFVDVSKYPELSKNFPLRVIPTQFFFDQEGNPYNPKEPEKMGMQLYQLKDADEHGFTAHLGGMTKDQITAVFDEMGVQQ